MTVASDDASVTATGFNQRMLRRPRPANVVALLLALVMMTGLVACSAPADGDRAGGAGTTAAVAGGAAGGPGGGLRIETVVEGDALDAPTALALRPGTDDELWITNAGDDSITRITGAGGAGTSVVTRTDAYAEHFAARPSGIAFTDTGEGFAVANDSNNEVRDMTFVANPERNRFFKRSNFMGPTLFATDTYSYAGQSKAYLADWPQPGYGHDAPDRIPQDQCPATYWSAETESCIWPREGSHVDMLHESPRSTGIVHAGANSFWVLDGCGTRIEVRTCRNDGHVVFYDFNRDHQEGNGFHGDGTVRRIMDAPFTRSDEAASGMVTAAGWVYYADTGGGVVRRFRPDSGTVQVLASSWHGKPPAAGESGPGIIDWSHVPSGPGDGDTPEVIDRWIATAGDQPAIAALGEKWIKPQETLEEYAYVTGSTVESPLPAGLVERPAGLAVGPTGLFVADNARGVIFELAWDGFRVVREIPTGAKGLSGLAYSPAGGGTLYFTDVQANRVQRVRLT